MEMRNYWLPESRLLALVRNNDLDLVGQVS